MDYVVAVMLGLLCLLLIAWLFVLLVERGERRSKGKSAVGNIYVDESDPEFSQGGGVYLQVFEDLRQFHDGDTLLVSVRKIGQGDKGGEA